MEGTNSIASSQASPTISNTSPPAERELLSSGRLACHHPCADKNRYDHDYCQEGLTPPPVGQERLSNGRLACHHLCTEKDRCGHTCCREGLRTLYRRRAPRKPRASRARDSVGKTPMTTPLNLWNTAINIRANGVLTPVTPNTPIGQNWSAAHFYPPTHFMESPAGSGRSVVLLSPHQRRPEGMPAAYFSRSEALRAGLTELREAGMWDEWSGLQAETDQTRDVLQPPIWTSSVPRKISRSTQTPQQIQPTGYRHQPPSFRQVQAERGNERDQYNPVPVPAMDIADQGIPQSAIDPALQSISIMARTEAGTNSATGTSTSTSTEPEAHGTTGAATNPPAGTTAWAPTSTAPTPDMATTDSPSAQSESQTPSALQLNADLQTSLFTNEQLNEILGGAFF